MTALKFSDALEAFFLKQGEDRTPDLAEAEAHSYRDAAPEIAA